MTQHIICWLTWLGLAVMAAEVTGLVLLLTEVTP